MKYADIVHRCFRCGYCKFTSDYSDFNCPTYRKFRFETYSPGGRMWLIRAWLNDEIKTAIVFRRSFSHAPHAPTVLSIAYLHSVRTLSISLSLQEMR